MPAVKDMVTREGLTWGAVYRNGTTLRTTKGWPLDPVPKLGGLWAHCVPRNLPMRGANAELWRVRPREGMER